MKGEIYLDIVYTYEEILAGWDQSTELFFMWLEDVCGIDRNSDVYRFLGENIHSVTDINDWVRFFNGDFDNVEATTEQYGIWRVCDKTA